ncbi:TonB-dependent receptor [candidate division KSB1 bacterium]|nr:TonB-dependent receptor [candidate division KSB1 bacterium]
MTSSNRFLKLVCILAVILLAMSVPETGLWAGTTGKISGKVTDAADGNALPGVNVVIVGTTLGAATDADGTFFILNIPPGIYSVRATMMGYAPVIQKGLQVSADRTTEVNFNLKEAVLVTGEEVVIVAERPLVEKDVTSSQNITTTKAIEALPVADIMGAVSLEPGVSVNTAAFEISIRGGGSDEISFQVDGMERSDKLNDKVYTTTNSATVSEIQVLTGGFNAEYGNIRSGVFNVVTKEGGRTISGSADYRFGPAHQKHFGPSAYGEGQYDWQLYTGSDSFEPVLDVEGKQLFVGWNKIAETQNGASYLGKNDWTAQQLMDVWKWRHRPIEYGDKPDQYLDAGLGGTIPFLDALGVKDAGFFVGYKFTREYPILPSINEFNQNNTYEGKINFKPVNAVKLVLSGMYGKTETSANGISWGDQVDMNYGYDVVGSALGRYKYYLSANDLLDAYTKQLGAKITHTINPSTYYEVRYNYFNVETEAGRSRDRNLKAIENIAGVAFDEAPNGWASEAYPLTDMTGTYDFFGGGAVMDTSFVKSHQLNIDFTSQISNQHLVKVGFEYGSDHVVRENRKAGSIILDPAAGNFLRYDMTPFHIAGYIQDKIEYGGLIANIGLRIEHYDANGWVYAPGNPYATFWARGGTEGYTTPDDLPKAASEAYTYVAPRIAFSHPVRQNTKFFFNYGVYYDEPTNRDRYGLFSESWDFGNPQGDIRFVGNPELEAPRTAAYEVGFEQSIADEWVVRTYFYAKDNSEQIGLLRVDGLDGSHAIGDFRNYEGVGKGAAGYDTRSNNNWEDIRGIEFKVTKMRGRFVTGWLNMDYQISTSGNYGYQNLNQDPLVAYYVYSAVKQQPQSVPSFIGNVEFHTPSDWGMLKGDWRLSILQTWRKGAKYIYNPTGLPTREVRTVYYYVNNYMTTLRLNKSFDVVGNLRVRVYMDINNVLNSKFLNVGVLNSAEQDIYYNQYVDGDNGFGKKIGEWEDEKGNNIFINNWVDKAGNNRAPIAPAKDFCLFYNPRSILLGVKLEF